MTAADARGAAVLINNIGVPGSPSSTAFTFRNGGENDQANMASVIKQLGFDWLIKENSTNLYRNQWNHKHNPMGQQCSPKSPNCMVCFIKEMDFSSYTYFLLHISSHGFNPDRGLLIQFLSDDKPEFVAIEEIVEALNDKNCPSLKGKTRILIIQACRQTNIPSDAIEDAGVTIEVAVPAGQAIRGVEDEMAYTPMDYSILPGPIFSGVEDEMVHTPMDDSILPGPFLSGNVDLPPGQRWMSVGSDENNAEVIPDIKQQSKFSLLKVPKNFLIVYATTDNRFSKIDTVKGSWFETALKKVVDGLDVGQRVDLLKILTKTASIVAARDSTVNTPTGAIDLSQSFKKNVCCLEHCLTERVSVCKVTEAELRPNEF
ncbi:uncharacterized protein LOC127847660 isoform X2 [Dreissena polymorpha]|uniref:Caspase family p20 domain-containing protein n=2 Tax=Dreissena polymorpha TaxID=45954 RepID=A0A9D4N4A6_DREPO|nr:uncharacterized protein LOC127847660 isoform X2 [Dreissena polymorpha]KAH3888845.1 hypothetical protein DPMN_012886 [Dreissena polymorpha]